MWTQHLQEQIRITESIASNLWVFTSRWGCCNPPQIVRSVTADVLLDRQQLFPDFDRFTDAGSCAEKRHIPAPIVRLSIEQTIQTPGDVLDDIVGALRVTSIVGEFFLKRMPFQPLWGQLVLLSEQDGNPRAYEPVRIRGGLPQRKLFLHSVCHIVLVHNLMVT